MRENLSLNCSLIEDKIRDLLSKYPAKKSGLLFNCIGIIDEHLQKFIANVEQSKDRVKPSLSLHIEPSAFANKLATQFHLNDLTETHFLPFRSPLLRLRAKIALESGEIDRVVMVDWDIQSNQVEIEIEEQSASHAATAAIAISGAGLITSYGKGVESFREGLLSGKPASLVLPFKVPSHFDRRFWMKEVLAEAVVSAGFSFDDFPFNETALIVVTRSGPVQDELEKKDPEWLGDRQKWAKEIAPFGLIFQISAACASVGFAMRLGKHLLQSNVSKRVLICGVEYASPYEIAGLRALKALSPSQPRPFDSNRKGIHLGEGAGALLLERADELRIRNHTAQAILEGCSTYVSYASAAATDIAGLKICMERCLGKYEPKNIGAIHAHATGTPEGDKAEAQAIASLFQGSISPPVFSHKGAVGHLLYSSGFCSTVSSLLALKEQIVFPTIGCMEPEKNLSLDIVCNKMRASSLVSVLANGAGFYGNFSSILLSK